MKDFIIVFIIGLIVGIAGSVYFQPVKIVEKVETKWKKETLVLPGTIDTIETVIEKTKYVYINRVKVDTVIKYETIIRKDTIQVVLSNLSFDPVEFNLKAKVFSMAAVDSAKFDYRINEDYINSIIKKHSVKPYPEWKKYCWFGVGVSFTAGIFYLVRQ